MKICPKCHRQYEGGKFCNDCGEILIEQQSSRSTSGGFNLNLGDANAISGGVNMSDNHSVSNNSVSNVDSHNVITNNITQVEREKTSEELKHERELAFRESCIETITNGILTSEGKRKLEDLQYRLGIDETTAARIISEVSKRSERKSATLSPVHQITYNNIKTAILANRLDIVNRLLMQLKAMVQRYSAEEIQYTYYMLQSILHPEVCISEFESHHEDKYWQSFWSSIAYRRKGNIEKSELLVADVGDKWIDTIPQDNVWILASVNALLDKDIDTAKSLYDNIMGDHSPLLSNLATCLYTLLYSDTLESDDLKKMEKDAEFFTNNLFGSLHADILNDKILKEQEEAELKRQEEERIRKEQEEAELKRQEEERIRKEQEEAELKRQEEERIRREQEEAELKRQEEERIRREQEEAELKRQEEERIRKEQEADELKRQEEERIRREQEEAELKRQEEERIRKEQEEAELKREEEAFVPKQSTTFLESVNLESDTEIQIMTPTARIEKMDLQGISGDYCQLLLNLSFSVNNMLGQLGYIEGKIYSAMSGNLIFSVSWFGKGNGLTYGGMGDFKNYCYGFVPDSEETSYEDFCIATPVNKTDYEIPTNIWFDYRVEITITDQDGNHISNMCEKYFKVKRIAHTFKKDEFQIMIV